MSAVTSSEVVHNFSVVAARVAAGEEITVTRYGKPVLKLVKLPVLELSDAVDPALFYKALSVRMTDPLGKDFWRGFSPKLPAASTRGHQYACSEPREAWVGGSFFGTLVAPSLRGVIKLAQA
jgi:hypothetical protein